ncbi:MAG: YifB family Mg chelatase-like AAA ATPase [Propionibacteriaceae bacterium]|jgi:magnesium chelatase family protein|nr:YifB family Mg chelatase-like AAA ATPase [Propionibacteriaceae bacterium]
MSTAAAWSVALTGLDGTMVEVEASITSGLPCTVLVGLPDTALNESRDRCRAAASSLGVGWPTERLTINLTPASLPKAGSHYDLAIMAAVLCAAGKVPSQVASRAVLIGEIGLDGRVRRVNGVLPAVLAARRAGRSLVIVPMIQVAEARLVTDVEVWGVGSLADLMEALHGRPPEIVPVPGAVTASSEPARRLDLADVTGQPEGRWALEVAAAGGHHLFFQGPPGVGKTMLAERLPTLLPPLTQDEALQVSALHSLAGEPLGELITVPPYFAPHHNATVAAMVGGGSRLAKPGAISLAHRGVLFLDEVPEFSTRVIESLRTPLESGWVSVARAQGMVRYPARFQLVLGANPCPCGRYGATVGRSGVGCRCQPMQLRRYNERISAPMLDRVDIHQRLDAPRRAFAGVTEEHPESSAQVAARVAEARERQRHRLAGTGWLLNAEVPGYYLRRALPPQGGRQLLETALAQGRVSARGVDKVIRLAWTLADLEGMAAVGADQVAAALSLNRAEWQVAAL